MMMELFQMNELLIFDRGERNKSRISSSPAYQLP